MYDDVSQYKKEIENLRKENTQLRTDKENIEAYLNNLIQIVPASVYWKDINSVIIGDNLLHAKIAGLKCNKDAVGKTDYDFIWKNQAKRIIENDKILMRSKQGLKLEEEATLSDSKIHTFLTSKEPMFDKNQNVIGVIGVSLDITELKETQKNLEKAKIEAEAANIAKTIFISNISHDIRTPLSAIIGLSHIIENSEKDPELKIHAHHIAQSADELLNMSNQVITAVSSNRLTVNDLYLEPFDLKHLVSAIINLESPPADLKHIQLATYIDDKIPNLLVGDHDKIYHIILNLVGNALKFTKNGPIQRNIVQ